MVHVSPQSSHTLSSHQPGLTKMIPHLHHYLALSPQTLASTDGHFESDLLQHLDISNINYHLASKPAPSSDFCHPMNEAICHPDPGCRVLLRLSCGSPHRLHLSQLLRCVSHQPTSDLSDWEILETSAPGPCRSCIWKIFLTSTVTITPLPFQHMHPLEFMPPQKSLPNSCRKAFFPPLDSHQTSDLQHELSIFTTAYCCLFSQLEDGISEGQGPISDIFKNLPQI